MTAAAYELADKLFKLAPWEWMNEITLIAVEDPESGRKDHISMMGMAGNHRSLALYHGPEARRRFNLMQDSGDHDEVLGDGDRIAMILDTVQLQCSFSGREDLFASEIAAIKKAGKKYRGDGWPSFRSFVPGRCPRPADAEETRRLCVAIEQVLEIAPTLGFGDDTLRFHDGKRDVLTRRLVDGVWTTCWTEDERGIFEFPTPAPGEFMVEKVRRHETAVPMEVCFEMIPSPIGKNRETSVYPYFLMVVEPKSGSVLGFDLMTVDDLPYEQIFESVPDALLSICDRQSVRPESIAVDSPSTHALLGRLAKSLGIRCQRKSNLPATRRAMDSLMASVFGGPM